jgi:diguanylate cyclase (GGDEF)-like protein/PAS domain S-box-containing protein
LDNENVIRPLILEDSINAAETMVGMLRNAGFAVRYKYIENNNELQETITEQPWDMLLASHQVDGLTPTQALTIIKKSGKDIPCIVYDSNRTDTLAAEFIRAGATDFVSDEVEDYLLLVIKRELANLQARRAHRHCKTLYHESEKRNRVLLNSSRDPIAYIHEGMHIFANQSYQDIFGYDDLEELESVPIMDLIAAENQQSFKDVLRSISNDAPPEDSLEYRAVREDGEVFTATMEFSRASIEGETCTQVMIHRKSDNQELEKEIQQLRQQDLLTGLYNHQYFMELVQDTVNRAANDEEPCALLYLEPDNFKHIKNTLGIAESNLVLTDIANFLRETTPDEAIIARYGGTIFSILLCGKLQAQAEKLAERIRHGLADKIFEVEGKSATTTCSIGITHISETVEVENAKRTLLQAESACSIAREQGGNTVHVFSAEDQLASLEADKKMLTLLQLALKKNRFQLQYQPIVSLHAEPGERYEVLLRMLDQNDNIIMPGEFLGTARHNELMTEIDRWVIKNAAKAILDKRKIGKEIQFFIKLSAESIRDPGMLAWVSKLLQAARLHGDSLVFELSEPDVRENPKITRIFSNGLKQLHCNLALDHAGKENTDLSYLKHLDVSYLKIDGSHIQNITSEESQELIRQVADLGRNNGFLTIAEHVQDPGCLAVLWQHGVNFIQGYYLQQPENNLDYDFTSSD